jgi:hypothetical protein
MRHGFLHIQEGDLDDADYRYGKFNRHFRTQGTLEKALGIFEAVLQRTVAGRPHAAD